MPHRGYRMPRLQGDGHRGDQAGARAHARTVKAATRAAEGNTVAEVRAIFDRAAAIDNIKSVSGRDLIIGKENDRVIVEFEYEREIPLFGPAFLLMRYSGSSR